MCRWFVYSSVDEACLLEDVLVTPEHSLSKMVNDHYLPGLIPHHPNDKDDPNREPDKDVLARNLVLNIDGLGLTWYTLSKSNFTKDVDGPRPALYKSTSPPINDYNYLNLCSNTETTMLFAHVRASSATAVSHANSHPFVFGRHSFMHNGTVSNFLDIRRQLCDLLDKDTYANVAGATDSEHVAALYMSYLTNARGKASWEEEYSCKDMIKALGKAIGTVIRLQKEALGEEATPNSLNLAVTDGFRLVTTRFRNHKIQQPPSLYWSTTAGTTLNRKYPGHPDDKENKLATRKAKDHGKHLIVASEPTTKQEKEWTLIDKNHFVMFEKNGQVKIEKIPYDEAWNVDGGSLRAEHVPSRCLPS